jgi:hypothetical protein
MLNKNQRTARKKFLQGLELGYIEVSLTVKSKLLPNGYKF